MPVDYRIIVARRDFVTMMTGVSIKAPQEHSKTTRRLVIRYFLILSTLSKYWIG
jgi:hypothetical protein